MAALRPESLLQLPDEMLAFTLRQLESPGIGPRLGQVIYRGGHSIQTPQYVVPMSRGVVPHVAHDLLQRHTNISAAYIALEDFIEKSPQKAPIFKAPAKKDTSLLRQYICLPSTVLSILGPRRIPAIPCPFQNASSSIAISTSVGFRPLETEGYIDACQKLSPDVSVGLVDLVQADRISAKRMAKSADRTHAWLRETINTNNEVEPKGHLFASIPPLEREQQSPYLTDLVQEYKSLITGVSVYTPQTTDVIPDTLRHLPRLCLTNPASPHDILTAISLGVDMITVPFVTHASEQGMALSFTFPSAVATQVESLAIDLWSTSHAASLARLTPDCTCYTCKRHHAAYVHHLLQAKEMLAWTLLQIHNFSVLDRFFQGVRASIGAGSFDIDVDAFSRAYQAEMPATTGQGPRVRGYQMKSVGGGESKKNPKAYGRLDDRLQKSAESEESVTSPDMAGVELEDHGFGESNPG